MSYIEITQKEFEDVLTSLGKWTQIKDNAKENIYMIDNIKIYSSIVNGFSRDVGKDAIRVVAWDVISNLPIKASEARVYRVENWSNNLKERINKVREEMKSMKKCKRCGAFMVERINSKTKEKFFGCMNYKNCKTTTSQINFSAPTVVKAIPQNINTTPTPTKSSEFVPNKYQEKIFDFIQNGSGHGVMEARAGTGKTSTIVKGTHYIPQNASVLFVAFNKHIVAELKPKVKNADVRTFNSLGHMNVMNAFGRVEFNEYKQREIVQNLVNNNEDIENEDKFNAITLINKVTSLVKGSLIDVSETTISELINYHDIESILGIETLTIMVKMTIRASLSQTNVIDYNDQIFFPIALNLPCKQYDFVLVDEGQDMNKAQCELILKSMSPSGRIIIVGDPAQSMYGFRGADTSIMSTIVDRLNATVLPLSMTYRCPLSHVRLANTIVPELEARPGAPEGILRDINYNEFFDMIKAEDMVICRNNAPLVRPAFELLSRGMNVCIKGKDIGENMINIIKKFKSSNIDNFRKELGEWKLKEIKKCLNQGNLTDSVEDKYEVLMILSEDCENKECVIRKIKTIFSDNTTKITFSSVHRAKGLESNRVFILEPSLMPSKHAIQEWQQIQERNIQYVAYTRSKSELYMVNE